MVKKYLVTILIICLMLISGCTKQMERGTFTDGVYKNTSLNLKISFPIEFEKTNQDMMIFNNGCQPLEMEDWKAAVKSCEAKGLSGYIWDLSLQNKSGNILTGILIEEIKSSNTTQELIEQQISKAKSWAGETAFITAPYELKIQGKAFQAFSYIAPNADNPTEEYFGMNAIRIEGNYAILITISVKSDNKEDFNNMMKIYTTENK